ncbi:hypothetical protein OIU77_025206 [Salix suchowensis]|uniref:Uncharacterized protein n=1 Tax=Salix suchowensis TaxID=1278906 RepID=A0ABQ9BYB2_9ROSI|nr:hypothetical protein OIU77_025206 [Salix suchowensis]
MMCMADYRESESRTGSESSGLTGHESDELAQQDSPRIKSMSSEWTDEKHSLYLKSMEASFVNQLYNSIDILGWPSQKERSVPNFSGEANCSPSCTRQFKVRQHGSRKKIKFGRPESQRSTAKDCRGFLASPWIQHFTPARKSEGATAPALQECAIRRRAINFNGKKAVLCCPATNSKLSPFGNSFSSHRDLVESNTGVLKMFQVLILEEKEYKTIECFRHLRFAIELNCIFIILVEMSGQNFVDEDIKGVKASSSFSSKRVKTDPSSSDQVVPHSNPPAAEEVTECISAAK